MRSKGAKFLIFCMLLVSAGYISLSLLPAVHAESVYDQNALILNYSTSTLSGQTSADLVVQVLKYEKYPVIAGDWFNVWLKVQNIGRDDAPHAVFELQPEYPFSSNDSLVRDYGILKGRLNAYKVDQTYDASDLIIKYRVQAAVNAPTGKSDLKIKISSDYGNPSVSSATVSLPIEIFSATEQTAVASTSSSENPNSKWAYGIVGLLIGVFLITILVLVRQKIKHDRH